MIKYAQKIGINKEVLSKWVDTPVQNFALKPVRQGTSLHSIFHELHINAKKGGEPDFRLFMKDVREESTPVSASGEVVLYRPGKRLAENEIRFLKFGQECGASVPNLYDVLKYESKEDGKKVKRVVMPLDCFDGSLDEKLLTLDQKGEELAFEFAKRTIDRFLRNALLAEKHGYATKDRMGYPTVYTTKLGDIMPIINQAIHGLIAYKFLKDRGEETTLKQRTNDIIEATNWGINFRSSEIIDRLIKYVAEPLASDEENHILLNLDPHPGNVLIRDEELPEYNIDDIFSDKPSDDNIVITDNYKFGSGPEAMVAVLISHPAFYRLLTQGRVEKLMDHTLYQCERIRGGSKDYKPLDSERRQKFSRKWAAAMRLGFLRRINFVIWTLFNRPEIAENIPLCGPKDADRLIEDFANLEDILTEDLTMVGEGFRELKINGIS